MDIETRRKISRKMKGHSNFEGHKHTHAEKIAIAFSQEGHRNAKDHKWAVDKETGKETRVKPGAHLPRGKKWGRTAGFKEWIKEEVLLEKKKVADAIEDFTQFAKLHLNLDSLPQIDLNYDLEAAENFGAFGGYYPEEQRIELNVAGRHTMDILRTLAHELVHYRQGTLEPLPEDAGDTGSPYENEANALAGVIMREYGKQNTHMFSENFMDGRNPEDKGDMARHGLKNKSIAQLKKIRSSDTATPRQKQLAHWYINMHKPISEAKATPCGRCGTTHVRPQDGGTCPALSKERNAALRKEETEVWDKENPVKDHEKLSPGNKARAKARAKAAGRSYPNMVDNMWAAKLQEDTPSDRLQGTTSLAKTYSKDTPGQKMRSLKQLREMIGQKPKCDECGDWIVRGKKHECTMKEARMSAAVKLQRAFQREQEKSAASRARAEKLLNPTPPTPTPPALKK